MNFVSMGTIGPPATSIERLRDHMGRRLGFARLLDLESLHMIRSTQTADAEEA